MDTVVAGEELKMFIKDNGVATIVNDMAARSDETSQKLENITIIAGDGIGHYNRNQCHWSRNFTGQIR